MGRRQVYSVCLYSMGSRSASASPVNEQQDTSLKFVPEIFHFATVVLLKCTIGSILFHHYSFWFDVTGASFSDPSVVGSGWVQVVNERHAYKANRVNYVVDITQTRAKENIWKFLIA